MAKESELAELFLSILGYPEADEWVALALEMDLRGYGATFEEAVDDLGDLVMMQIGFAMFKSQPEMIWKPADPVWFGRFAEARQERLHELSAPAAENGGFRILGMPIPPPHVIASLKPEFDQANA